MRRASLLGTLLLGMAGCGDSGSGTNPDLLVLLDMAVPTVAVGGTVLDYAHSTPTMPMPIAGVQVCVYPDTTACAMTDATGKYMNLLAPEKSQVGISFTKSGFLESIAELTTTTAAVTQDYLLIDSGTAIGLAAVLGSQIDDAKSIIAVSVGDTMGMPMKGVAFASTPAPAMGSGPFYFAMPASGVFVPDKNATATSENGAAIFLNMAPGDYSVTATAVGKTCVPVPSKAWVGSPANQAKAKAIAKKFVSFSFVCM